jgi:6-phosphogluconolactonase (cycloisomerase 2 family)
MKRITQLVGVGGIAVAATALFAGHAQASPDEHSAAVFVQTDNLAGNAIVAYDRGPDGALQQAGTFATGGKGGALTGAVVDFLASQGSLAYDRNDGLLYAVNAGSDTITVFRVVGGDRLSRRQVIGSGGSFPVSVAVRGNVLYVLNARSGGSVQGYLRFGDALVRIPGWHRSLGLDPTASPEFTNTPGQVAFTPDGRKLVVTTKANGSNIDVFDVNRFGGLSAAPVVTADPGQVPFAVSFDAGNHLVVAEAANAVATFTVNADGTLALVDREQTGQAATCWIVRDGSAFYVSNAGSANLSGYHDAGTGALTALGTTSTDPGTVDAAVSSDGQFLYAQTGANGIVDEFRAGTDGSLTRIGAVTVPNSAGGEGIAAG